VSASTFVVNPVVSADKPNFDPLKDFSYLGLIAKGPLLFIVHTGIANNLQEFVAAARSHPEKINFATGGYGSAGHMAAESFKLRANLNVPVVLYKGTGPAFTDLIGGHISGIMDPMLTSLPLAKGGKATALALAGPARSPLAPDVPTFSEAGYPGFEFYTWYGLWGPANLPKPVVNVIEQALKVVSQSAEAKTWFEQQGLVYSGIGGPQFEQFARDEQALYADIVKKAKLKSQ
jgi:tripartite-type tricarboxylate transporter receptor subunit TctC